MKKEKQKAYKVVREVDGELRSLYHTSLERHGLSVVYAPEFETGNEYVCFVFKDVPDWEPIGIQIWECEGYLCSYDDFLPHFNVSLSIDPDSKFMKNVKLTTRIK